MFPNWLGKIPSGNPGDSAEAASDVVIHLAGNLSLAIAELNNSSEPLVGPRVLKVFGLSRRLETIYGKSGQLLEMLSRKKS
jgi:hypothetical protein